MKKLLTSLLCVMMVVCFMPSMAWAYDNSSVDASQIDADNYTDLQEAINDAESGTTILLGEGPYELESLIINKPLTLQGGENTEIKLTGTGNTYPMRIENLEPGDKVQLNNLNITAAGRGILVSECSPNFVMNHVNLTVKTRAISFEYLNGHGRGLTVTMQDSVIKQSDYEDEKTGAYISSDRRGIQLWNIKDASVSLKNTDVLGFGYGLNVNGDPDSQGVVDTENLEVSLEDCQWTNWGCFNIWGSYGKYTIDSSIMTGVNTSDSDGNSFATLVFNDDIYNQFDDQHAVNNTLNIKDSTITNSVTGKQAEQLIRIDCGVTQLIFEGTNYLIDTSGDIDSALYLRNMRDLEGFSKNYVTGIESVTIQSTNPDFTLLPDYFATKTFIDNDAEAVRHFSRLDELYGLDYEAAAARHEQVKLLKDVQSDTFTIDGNKGAVYGGWTLDLNGHTMDIAAWEGGKIDTIGIKDSSADRSGSLKVRGETVPAAYIDRADARYYFLGIEQAIAAAEDGETIVVMKDLSLPETIDIPSAKALIIKGDTPTRKISAVSEKKTISLKGISAGLTLENLTFSDAILTLNSSQGDVTLRGCTFSDITAPDSHSDKSGALNIINTKGANIIIEKCNFENISRGTSSGAEMVGVYINGTVGKVTVNQSEFKNIAGTALSLRGSENYEITGNTFENWAYGSANDEGRAIRIDYAGKDNTALILTGNTFTKNETAKESYVKVTAVASNADNSIDLSDNYWGGMNPATGTVAENVPVLELTLKSAPDDVLTADELQELEKNGVVSGLDDYRQYINPPVYPTTQKPIITADNATVTLGSYGTTATITVDEGYELVDVTVNGVSQGKVTFLYGLKTGDEVVVITKKIQTAEDLKAEVKALKLVARSANEKAPSGKKAIKVYWFEKNGKELNLDGYEIYRSTKKNSGYGTKPIYKTTKSLQYFNTSAKKGTRYYYKVRGYKVIEGEKTYTSYSLKAIRTAK